MDTHYKIIGGDGAEYGPVSLAELQGWIGDGRVAGTTQVWRSDVSLWSTADRYQELQQDLTRLYANSPAMVQQLSRPVGFWARLGAYLVDQIVLLPVFIALWLPIADARHWDRLPPQPPTVVNDVTTAKVSADVAIWVDRASLVFFPVFFAYEVLLNGSFGATLGKMLIGARIRQFDGSRLTFSRAILRWLAARLSQFLLFGGFLLVAIRADKRGLHDFLAGTKVVYLR